VADANEFTELKDQAKRYRQAAHDALEQLDWCIGYLHGARKVGVAAALARNRAFIRRRLLHEAEEEIPSAMTGES
jgi:hypothetical protein